MQIRDAGSEDLAWIVDLAGRQLGRQIAIAPDVPTYSAMFAGLRLSGGYLRVVDRDGLAVGFLAGIAAPLLPWSQERCAMEMMLAGDPSRRPGRAGFALRRDFEAWGRANGCSLVRLTAQAGEEGERAGRLYAHEGYAPQETSHLKRLA